MRRMGMLITPFIIGAMTTDARHTCPISLRISEMTKDLSIAYYISQRPATHAASFAPCVWSSRSYSTICEKSIAGKFVASSL